MSTLSDRRSHGKKSFNPKLYSLNTHKKGHAQIFMLLLLLSAELYFETLEASLEHSEHSLYLMTDFLTSLAALEFLLNQHPCQEQHYIFNIYIYKYSASGHKYSTRFLINQSRLQSNINHRNASLML